MMIANRAHISITEDGLVGSTAVVQALLADIDTASRSNAKVLITGETGVGKEVVAQAIHRRGARRTGPFVTVNCAGVPESLLESEFFGHARGSFTGAVRDRPGLLRQAHRGTVLLDEVGEMTPRMQALLLRFLETGEVQTVGGTVVHSPVDTRVITATNRDLFEASQLGEFRKDLFYRLNVFQIRIPPLRHRRDDVALLVEHYGRLFAVQYAKPLPVWSAAALDHLSAHDWPGNIRELKNVVERTVLGMTARTVEVEHLPKDLVRTRAVNGRSDGGGRSDPERVEVLLRRILVDKESFWNSAYAMFMSRDITREDLRYVVRVGLQQTQGSYRALIELFNMGVDDYRRFLGFLKQHECHIPFQGFRLSAASLRGPRGDH